MPLNFRLSVSSVAASETAGAAGEISAGTESIVSVGVPVWSGPDGPTIVDQTPGSLSLDGSGRAFAHEGGGLVPLNLDSQWASQQGFKAKAGTSLTVRSGAGMPAVVFLGFGPKGETPGAAGKGAEVVRKAAAALVKASGRQGAALLLVSPSVVEKTAGEGEKGTLLFGQAVAEGASLASYRFVSKMTEDDGGRIDHLVVSALPGVHATAIADGVRRGHIVAEAVAFARDLINEPPSSLTPRRLGEISIDSVASRQGVTIEVWEEDRIAEERLGGLLGVARGSAEPPRLIWGEYNPPESKDPGVKVPHVVIVGKGITFDSGGLSLKTPGGMETMKTDMSGAAAVLGALSVFGDLGVKAKVTAIACVTENMPGSRATKPGDVLKIRNGKTIEVLNTDAEGRLVLADGLSLAEELNPDAIIDLATLTGAAVVALGASIAGLLGSDDDLIASVIAASERAGESVWQLPLTDEYASHIDSDIADMKNVGKAGQAGTIAAALLLAKFVGDVPWAHLDIAGPARSDSDKGYLSKGGTGFGVRTLIELVDSFGK